MFQFRKSPKRIHRSDNNWNRPGSRGVATRAEIWELQVEDVNIPGNNLLKSTLHDYWQEEHNGQSCQPNDNYKNQGKWVHYWSTQKNSTVNKKEKHRINNKQPAPSFISYNQVRYDRLNYNYIITALSIIKATLVLVLRGGFFKTEAFRPLCTSSRHAVYRQEILILHLIEKIPYLPVIERRLHDVWAGHSNPAATLRWTRGNHTTLHPPNWRTNQIC